MDDDTKYVEGLELHNCSEEEADVISKYVLACLEVRDGWSLFRKQKRISGLVDILDEIEGEWHSTCKTGNGAMTERVFCMLTTWISGAINFA